MLGGEAHAPNSGAGTLNADCVRGQARPLGAALRGGTRQHRGCGATASTTQLLSGAGTGQRPTVSALTDILAGLARMTGKLSGEAATKASEVR